MPRIKLVKGDITQEKADAIVNAANSSLLGGGGVDGAIHRAGGPAILEECKRIRAEHWPDGLPVGEAVATMAGDLPARWVIHTVGPTYAKFEDRSHLLRSCFVRALEIADELGAETVVFPAVSTGVYRYPLDEAASLALDAVSSAPTKVSEVRFVLFNDEAMEAFRSALQGLEDPSGGMGQDGSR